MLNTNLGLNIDTLKQYTINMIEECIDILDLSFESMLNQDIDECRKVIKQDDRIDELREYIRDRSIELLALKQPMAKDLRYIYSLGVIAIELERIGDYAVNIAEETIKIGKEKYVKELVDIPKMYKACRNMVIGLKESLENEDSELATNVAMYDDKVDDLYSKLQKECIEIMNNNVNAINQGVGILFIGRCFERIGDHATNICEKIIYAINGEMVEIG